MSPSSWGTNVRVQGPVVDIFRNFNDAVFTGAPREGFMARMDHPSNGFDPFKIGDDIYVTWIANSWDLPAPVAAQIVPYWHNSLGAAFIANPREDAYGIVWMHGAMWNTWSPLLQTGGMRVGESAVWHGLGGIMAKELVIPEGYLLNPLLGAMGLASASHDGPFEPARLKPEELAAVVLAGVTEKVAGKAMAMTPKWMYIDEGLRAMGSQILTQLGGMKAVFLHPKGDHPKRIAIQMMAQAAKVLGIYISGGDEGTSSGPWTDDFARIAPNNMAGSSQAHHLIQGEYPSEHTARGIYATFKPMLHHAFGSQNVAIFFQGVGSVGSNVLRLALADGRPIFGISDASVEGLLKARQMLREVGGQYLVVPLVWDRKAALGFKDAATVAAEERKALAEGLRVADGLSDAMMACKPGNPHSWAGLLSPNSSSHQITPKRLAVFAGEGGKLILGGDNNMLSLDDRGSNGTTARKAVREGVFVAADSGINRKGAFIVLRNALEAGEGMIADMDRAIVGRVEREWREAFLHTRHDEASGEDIPDPIPPQIWSDEFAQREWNDALASGTAIGGTFPTVLGGGGVARSAVARVVAR